MSINYDSETRSSRTSIRRVRRIEEPRSPFLPWGLLLPLSLLGLSVFSCMGLQNKTEAAAERALTDADLGWANAEASGRYVYLTGDAPDESAAKRAVRVVEASVGKTLIGREFQPLHVYESFEYPAPKPAPVAPQRAEDSLSPDWSFRSANGVLRLEGQVPDEATRLKIITTAQARSSLPVEDALTEVGYTAPEGYVDVALRGINTVVECDRGVASFRSEVFSLRCELPARTEASVRTAAGAAMPLGRVGRINISTTEDVNACEGSLAELLGNAQIQFASNSARIDQSSAQLISSIADAAKTCPGSLRIEGHTDKTGNAAKNDELSARRAEAVRAALVNNGVSADRLIARGYGSRVPIADNNTSQGRALNRRIQIKVVRPDE